jgi:hypothetical protein
LMDPQAALSNRAKVQRGNQSFLERYLEVLALFMLGKLSGWGWRGSEKDLVALERGYTGKLLGFKAGSRR